MITPKIVSAYVKELGSVMEQLEMYKSTCTVLDYDLFYNQKSAIYREMRSIAANLSRQYIGVGVSMYLNGEPIAITSHYVNGNTLMCMYKNLKFPSSIISTEFSRVQTKDEYESENRNTNEAMR